MRIAQVSPLFESVPPRAYGGTERVVHWITEELVRRGHDVTLFASGDSKTSARLVPVCERALRLSGAPVDGTALHLSALLHALREDGGFDVVHAHVEWSGVAIAAATDAPVLTTLHGRLDIPEIQSVVARARYVPLVSISDAQRAPLPRANWIATVPHGLPVERVPFVRRAKDYVAFVGRISREKRPDLAIRAAMAARVPLKIAAKRDGSPDDTVFWRETVEPLLARAGGAVEFLGEVGEAAKRQLIGNAKALLFPVDWPEPFGLVAIEALAAGTPVIARPYGALPEIVEDGRTGYLVETVEEMAGAIDAVESLSRADARHAAETRFSTRRMVDDYERVYELVAARPPASGTLSVV